MLRRRKWSVYVYFLDRYCLALKLISGPILIQFDNMTTFAPIHYYTKCYNTIMIE